MVCLGRPYHFKFIKCCLPETLFGPFLNILTHLIIYLSGYHEVLSHMMPIYQIVLIQLSLFSFPYYFTNFTILLKKMCWAFIGDHESSAFRKPVVK